MTAPFVHPTAIVDEGANLGDGTRVWHFCHVMSGARLGRDVVLGQNGYVGSRVVVGDGCRIQNNVSLYDGVELRDGVFIGPSVVFTNVRRPRARFPRKDAYEATLVESGATVGANATIVCGVTVGASAMVGAGAVVTDDVPAFAVAVGAPARVVGWVCRCGERLDLALAPMPGDETSCGACRRTYRARGGHVVEADHDLT